MQKDHSKKILFLGKALLGVCVISFGSRIMFVERFNNYEGFNSFAAFKVKEIKGKRQTYVIF